LLADAIDRYIVDVLPEKAISSQGPQIQQLLWWKSCIGKYSLADVTPSLISDCRNKLASDPIKSKRKSTASPSPLRYRSPATVVRYLAVLSHLFTVATKDWEWATDNPLEKVRKPSEPKGRDRFLSDEERTNFLAACQKDDSPYLYSLVVLALSTGMQRGEMMSLRWRQVDFNHQRIILQETKNGETRSLPLVGQAFEQLVLLSKIRRIDSDTVFPGKRAGVAAS
jgi:integrase